jgi:DHA2 family methylenomycin A resistance protein-like MFS transporter
MSAAVSLPRPGGRIGVITAATSLGFAVVQLDGSILNVALPQIGTALHASVDGLQWMVASYLLVFGALLLSAGALGDRIGSKRAFISGFAIFGAASVACGVATTPTALIAFRAIQGSGAALLVPCSLALLNQACGEDAASRTRAISIWTAAGGVALAAGPAASGLLVSYVGWRSIFLVNLPIAAFGMWLAHRYAMETNRAVKRTIDLPGQILAILTLLGLVWAVIEAGPLGWAAPRVILGLAVAAISGIGFVMVESRTKEPVVPLGFFCDPTFSAATVAGFVLNLTIFGLSFALAIYFQRVLLYSPSETGWAFVPFAVGVTVSNVVSGWLSARAGARMTMTSGLIVAAGGFALLGGVGAATTYGAMLPAQLLIRFGIGLAVPLMTSTLLSTVPRSKSGVASGALNAVRQAGGAIGVALFGMLMRDDVVEGIRNAVIISAGLLMMAAVVVFVGVPSEARTREPKFARGQAEAD